MALSQTVIFMFCASCIVVREHAYFSSASRKIFCGPAPFLWWNYQPWFVPLQYFRERCINHLSRGVSLWFSTLYMCSVLLLLFLRVTVVTLYLLVLFYVISWCLIWELVDFLIVFFLGMSNNTSVSKNATTLLSEGEVLAPWYALLHQYLFCVSLWVGAGPASSLLLMID